jgi:HEAT repeat protein
MRPLRGLVPALLVCCLSCTSSPGAPAGDVPGLIEQLKSGDESLRADAAEALGSYGIEAREAVPALGLALRDEYELVRRGASVSLAAIGPDKRAIRDLTMALKDSDATVRQSAALALGAAGPDARAAIPALTGLLRDPSEEVRQAAATALDRIDQRTGKEGSRRDPVRPRH